uniref:Uncharacterized protein n=1 Tax=Opuntia streptacantha TaxID=393608 RepID=A0A7C9CTF2_OPUST
MLYPEWNKCLARVSRGMYSATSSLSSPSQQYPIKFASLWCLNFPTAQASSANCLRSGQASLVNFLTAIQWLFLRRRGAFSPLSDTMNSELKSLVAALRSANENSAKAGTPQMAELVAENGGFWWLGVGELFWWCFSTSRGKWVSED